YRQYFERVGEWVKSPGMTEALWLRPNIPVEVASMHLMNRTGPDGTQRADLVMQLVQTTAQDVDPHDPSAGKFAQRTGATAIFDQSGPLRYVVAKRADRSAQQRECLARMNLARSCEAGFICVDRSNGHGHASPLRINLAAMHRGY